MSKPKQDVIIIGGGVAGLVSTSVLAQLGLRITLIEKQNVLGGDCLHTGCVPSKSLIYAAKLAHLARHSKAFGLGNLEPQVDLAKIRDYVQGNIAHIQQHDDPERFRGYGAEVIFGTPKFIDPHTIEVNGQSIQAKRFIISTGSSPIIPPIQGLQACNYLTNHNIFKLGKLPQRLVVLGTGAIGVELAQSFARLGSQVTCVEMLPQILPTIDTEISTRLQSQLEQEGVRFYLATLAKTVRQTNGYTELECQTQAGETLTLPAEALLVATGQAPNVAGLNLKAAGVNTSKGGIIVDKRLRTTAKHIFAAGDVIESPYKFTHVAEYHAGILIANIAFRLPKKINNRVIPAVVYSNPEIATVGMNEAQAKLAGITPHIARFDFKEVDRAIIEHETTGLAKLLIHKNRIIGATLLGPQAGELISEIVLAMQANLKISHISSAIHAYPTLAQINRRTVNSYLGAKLFNPKTKKLVHWIQKLLP